MSAVRVVLADDHPMFRFGLRAALATAPELELVAEAAEGAELLEVVARTRPDVVITDLAMPGVDGISAIAELQARFPQVAALVLTMNASDDQLLGALRAGARGYLLKDADRDQIVRAVVTVAEGGTVYAGEMGRRLVERATAPPSPAQRPFPELTDRELEIVRHVAVGRSNHEIGAELFLAEKTVRNNVSMVLSKLGLRDRAALVAVARDRGL